MSSTAITSPLALWETLVALTKGNAVSAERADAEVRNLIRVHDIRIVPVSAEIGALAVEASRRFGHGRHPASLNFGDCFAYACARHHGVPLLFKGEDFSQTDVESA